jgi:hypothetical protein
MGNTKTEELLSAYGTKLNVTRLAADIEAVKIQFKAEGLTLENASTLLMCVMEDVNRYRKMTGHEKKRLVIKIMEHCIDELCPGEKTDLERVLRQMVPTLIDGIIHVGKLKTFRKRLACRCFS